MRDLKTQERVAAPIRVPAKTAAALEARIPTLLGRGSPRRDVKDTIHGNRVQIRLLRNESARAPKVIGFVHNADSDPLLLRLATDFKKILVVFGDNVETL